MKSTSMQVWLRIAHSSTQKTIISKKLRKLINHLSKIHYVRDQTVRHSHALSFPQSSFMHPIRKTNSIRASQKMSASVRNENHLSSMRWIDVGPQRQNRTPVDHQFQRIKAHRFFASMSSKCLWRLAIFLKMKTKNLIRLTTYAIKGPKSMLRRVKSNPWYSSSQNL